jgi:tetratricopeptide (TPR) repeat protein
VLTRCPSDEDFHEFAASEGEDRAALEAHAATCGACRARLADERGDAALFAELRAATHSAGGAPEIPGYRIEAELARGGQGTVYRALQLATNRAVALKVLGSSPAASSARARRRFELEVELGARLAHPGIVTVFDSGIAEGAPWFAMELVEGEPLDDFVARRRLALDRRLALFLELCAAVAHAHRSGILHRDLKPSNVLVDGSGRVRVLDFGTALALGARAARRRTAPGEFLGTLAYASPEQVSAGAEACDTRSDVYALGVVLYELATGALPIDVDGSLAEVVERITRGTPVPARRLAPGLSRDFEALLTKALAREPERRYASVEAMARDVGRLRTHRPLEARPAGPLRALGLALRRHWRAAAVAGLVFGLATLLAGEALRSRLAAAREREQVALVRSVFEDVLAAAAPQRMGGDAPLREVLALAAREIETSLADAPDVQAGVRFTIGDTYRRLLLPGEATTHLRAALERFRAVGADPLEVARCLDALGAALTELGNAEAIAVQEEALALRRAHLGDADPRIAASERALALALAAQPRDADLDRARALLESARERFRRAHGEAHVEVAETELALGRLERWSGATGAERLAWVVSIFERPENARDPRRIACLTELARRLQEEQRLDEAEEVLARVERLAQELYGDELATDVLRQQANVRFARGDFGGAEELTRRALAYELRHWARRRQEEAPVLLDVAARLEAAHAPQREPPYVEAFRHLRRFEGDGAFELAQWMNGIVVTLAPVGRLTESEALLTEALAIRCRAWGADCPIRQRTLDLLGETRLAAGRPAEARAPLEESVAIAERRGEPETAARARELLATAGERP